MKQARLTLVLGLFATLALIPLQPCGATAVAGPDGTAAQGRRIVFAAPTVRDAAAIELIAAVIDELRLDRGEIVVRGKPVPLHPTQLKVLRDGQTAGVAALRPGQAVHFALDAEASGPRRIILIQIDR